MSLWNWSVREWKMLKKRSHPMTNDSLALSGSEKVTGWRLFLKTIVARAYPRIIGQQREKSWVFFEIFLPMLAVAAYVYVYRAIGAPEEYVGFVVVGGAMTAFWMNVLWSMSSQLFWEKETGNLALYIMAPSSMMAILLGMALGGMFTTTVRAVSILALGSLMFDVHFAVENVPLLGAVFILALVALYGMGMMFASMFLLLGREGWHFVSLAQEPVFLLSGTFFPIRSFNFWVAVGASIIPLTLALDAIRQLSFSSGAELGFLDVRTEVGVLAGLSVLFLIAARYLLQLLERLAIAEGRLTEARA